MADDATRLPLPEMQQWLKEIGAQAQPIRRRALALSAEAINAEAQFDAPVLTGLLKESHVVDHSNPDRVALGANTTYAAASHETHPTKARWYLKAILEKAPEIMRKALERAVRELGGPRQ